MPWQMGWNGWSNCAATWSPTWRTTAYPALNVRGYLEAMKDGVIQPTPELVASLRRGAPAQPAGR
jgi:hypothetical protein